MVIIDIIDNGLLDSKYDNNLTCLIIDKLKKNGISFAVASELCADETFNNAIIVRKDLNKLDSSRSSYDQDRDYFVNDELKDKGIITYSFLREYIAEDAWINAADDIVNNILKFNNYQNMSIRVDLEVSDFQYIVQSEDNLYDIASRYNTTPEKIIEKNNLASRELYPGQILILEGPTTTGEVLQYIVRAGDSLQDIATEYKTTVEDLRKYNNLTEDNLKIGQVLVINPVAQTLRPVRYIVKSGDSLYSIARRYNINVVDIKKINKLDSNFLKVGQQLMLPE